MIFGVPSRTARAALRLIAAFFLVNGHSRVFRGFIGLGFTEVLSETLPELLGSVLRFMAPIQILRPTICITRAHSFQQLNEFSSYFVAFGPFDGGMFHDLVLGCSKPLLL